MTAEEFISLADRLRSRVHDDGGDLNASNYLVHTTLLRALREQTLDDVAPEALTVAIETAGRRAG